MRVTNQYFDLFKLVGEYCNCDLIETFSELVPSAGQLGMEVSQSLETAAIPKPLINMHFEMDHTINRGSIQILLRVCFVLEIEMQFKVCI